MVRDISALATLKASSGQHPKLGWWYSFLVNRVSGQYLPGWPDQQLCQVYQHPWCTPNDGAWEQQNELMQEDWLCPSQRCQVPSHGHWGGLFVNIRKVKCREQLTVHPWQNYHQHWQKVLVPKSQRGPRQRHLKQTFKSFSSSSGWRVLTTRCLRIS